MNSLKFLVFTSFLLGVYAEEASTSKSVSQLSFCGLKEPDEEKTCISLRLPWQEEPIYFCTEKAKISYKERCGHNINRWCYGQEREQTLQVATPWDCCPLTSTPDYCVGRTCPAAPFNRTCEENPPDKKNIWDCCSTFYCDKDVKPESCHMKRLTPGCMKAPKDKTNCIGFKDQHGCCNKYQCEGDAKPGMCPAEAQALKFKQLMEDATKSDKLAGNKTSLISRVGMHSRRHFYRRLIGSSSTTYMSCTGDYTCPGSMKCCSMDIENYHGVRKILSRSSTERAVYGYCMDPIETDEEKLALEGVSSSPETVTGLPEESTTG